MQNSDKTVEWKRWVWCPCILSSTGSCLCLLLSLPTFLAYIWEKDRYSWSLHNPYLTESWVSTITVQSVLWAHILPKANVQSQGPSHFLFISFGTTKSGCLFPPLCNPALFLSTAAVLQPLSVQIGVKFLSLKLNSKGSWKTVCTRKLCKISY